MAARSDTYILSDEELTVPEVNLSGVVLRAGAPLLGKHCENYNNEFMLCRNETMDPSACINEGKAVTNCALHFFRMVKTKCGEEFERFYRCVDRSSSNFSFMPCRKTQSAFENCMLANYNLQAPEYGYFCRVKVHETDRPKPEEEPLEFDAADLPAKLPDNYLPDRPQAKYGLRSLFGL